MRPRDLLCPKPGGLYCAPGDFYIDPVRAVPRALVTHGHSDHARSGHGSVLATRQTLDIMGLRYGEDFAGATQEAVLGETVDINGVAVTFHPAGHVLGSAQICVEYDGTRIVASGDYKRQPDATCLPFEPIRCDVFITEATFGLPVFRHPPDTHEIGKLIKSTEQFPERAHLVGAYALGKAQRVIRLIRDSGYGKPVYIHGALAKLCEYYQIAGHRPRRPQARDRRGRLESATSPARSSSARRPPSPTAGRGAFPIRSPASRRAGCASASAPSRAASNCR